MAMIASLFQQLKVNKDSPFGYTEYSKLVCLSCSLEFPNGSLLLPFSRKTVLSTVIIHTSLR